jgi:hypothetical protein
MQRHAAVATLEAAHTVLKWMCRDTLLRAFDSALAGAADEHPIEPSMQRRAQALVRLALAATADSIA